ncbi:class I SAM-dependent methyltransferase [Micromonospora globbae]|uniref:class I SAM-dependent methyltransferase n=1 Tax=Micromonospora globbae TaxID=1894969 RepID=UPI00343D6F65
MTSQLGGRKAVRITDARVVSRLGDGKPDIGTLWELCVYLEWDRKKTVDGIADWLGPQAGQRVLDCACGSGFPGIDLILRGYNVTCSDGSPDMLDHFRDNALLLGATVDPVLAQWAELSSRVGTGYDVVMCRGASLAYAGTWDDDAEPDREAVDAALQQFVACLRPGGRCYIDITRAEDYAHIDPQRSTYPPFWIGEHLVELEEEVTNYHDRQLREWYSRIMVDDRACEFFRRSHALSHPQIVALMTNAGLEQVRREYVAGESYDVFVGTKPMT